VTRRSAVIVSDNINVEDELISTLPLSTHSAVEMFLDSALYKFMIDIDTDIKYFHKSERHYANLPRSASAANFYFHNI